MLLRNPWGLNPWGAMPGETRKSRSLDDKVRGAEGGDILRIYIYIYIERERERDNYPRVWYTVVYCVVMATCRYYISKAMNLVPQVLNKY